MFMKLKMQVTAICIWVWMYLTSTENFLRKKMKNKEETIKSLGEPPEIAKSYIKWVYGDPEINKRWKKAIEEIIKEEENEE